MTSFGMNLQELNNNGQSLKVFLLTGFFLFLGALLGWVVMTTINRAYSNFKQRTSLLKRKKPQFDRDWMKTWKLCIIRPKRGLTALFQRGVALGLLTGGRYDPQGYVYAYNLLVDGEDSMSLDTWTLGRFSLEIQYLLGVRRIPTDEEYHTMWNTREKYL